MTTIDFDKIPFVQAKTYLKKKARSPQVIVLHSMEAPEKPTTAEAVAKYFTTKQGASAHYCVDNNSIVQCVQTKDVAAGAPGLNQIGIHIEMAGYAKQSAAEWKDEYSKAVIENAALLCAKILCPKYDIPPRILSLEDVRKAKFDTTIKGFCTHHMGSLAFKVMGGHTDPGPNFPLELFIELVKFYGRSV